MGTIKPVQDLTKTSSISMKVKL